MLSGMSQSIGYLGASLCPFAVGLLRDVHHGPEWPSVLVLAIILLCLRFGFQAARPGYVLAASEGSVRN